jgi:arylsulfate sulfotransferase
MNNLLWTPRWVLLCVVAILALADSPFARGVTILSGPTFTPSSNAPLAGTLQLATDVDSRVSVLVSDGTNLWERDFYDFATTHSETLLGFHPGRTNLILVTVFDKYRNEDTAPQLLEFDTAPLPSGFPNYTVLIDKPDMMEPGYTMFIAQNRTSPVNTYATIVDNSGELVWYWKPAVSNYDNEIRQLANGDLFLPQQSPYNNFIEINMLGQTVKTWNPAAGYPVDIHDGVPTDHGTILYFSDITRSVTNFPIKYTESNSPLGTASVEDTPAVEMSASNSALLHVWSPVDLLDPTRISYLTGNSPHGIDNEHGNAVLEDPSDNSVIISLRNQNAVFKVTRAGQVKWILGPPANWGTNFQKYLLTPVGAPFEWNYGQHGPMLTPRGTLLVYDDGNIRASPWDPPVADQDNYSRAVEYSIDETNMTVSQVWDSTAAGGDRLFTEFIGNADWLPERRNVQVTYGYITYINGVHPSPYAPNATMSRIVEYTHDPVPQIVFELSFFDANNTNSRYLGFWIYRSHHIDDLYAHPANPVTDLVASPGSNSTAHLEFSADPTYSYAVQMSTDLRNWATIGTAVQAGEVGDFEFDDLSAGQSTTRFYRVVTQ